MNCDEPFARAEEAAAFIRLTSAAPPTVAIVLGSGLSSLADGLVDPEVFPYATIPHFAQTSVAGHSGNLILGSLGETRVAILQGRFHYYEGHDPGSVVFPIRVLQRLGVGTLILTAATGGIHPDLRPGDIVCLADHINMLGFNPLRGGNDDRFGPRFPDMSEVYSASLRRLAEEAAASLGISLKSGVYAAMPGPSYETPAEIRMLRVLGADVVGMSTAPEAIVARHCGMSVLAFALVANAAAGASEAPISHEEVLAEGRAAGPRIGSLIRVVVERLSEA